MYRALWTPFLTLKARYWPTANVPLYLCTDGPIEGIRAIVGDLPVLHSDVPADNTRNYITRVISYLRSITTPYVVFWYDDMFLSGPVQTEAFANAVRLMETDPRINLIKLSACSYPFTGDIHRTPYGQFQQARSSDSYILNVQPSIVNRSFLLNVLIEVDRVPDKNGPSDYETHGTEIAKRLPGFYLRSLTDILPVFRDGGVVRSGILDADARAFLEREGLSIPTDDRGCIYDSRDPTLTATLNPQLKWELQAWYGISV
jgi:hypothetical protein